MKSVYVAAYKNLAGLHKLRFADIRKRHIQAVIDNCPLGTQAKSHMKSVCNQMYKFAIDLEIVATNFAVKVALILCYTGLRPSELAQIKTADVHLAERYMRGGMKTKAGKNRVIPISQKILPLIESLYNPAKEFLLNPGGEPLLNGDNLRTRIWDKSSFLKNHLPHDGRHTCATLMDNADIPLKTKQLILGHSSNDITSKVYTHKTLEQLVAAIDRI